MRYLVTGVAGFIGSHLADRLIGDGHQVWGLDDFCTGAASNINRDVRMLPTNGWGEAIVNLGMQFDGVFHLGARASVPYSMAHPMLSHAAGPTFTLQLLEMCRDMGVPKFIYASSSSVYGNQKVVGRDSPLRPVSPYAASKVAGEAYCQVYSQWMGMAALRYFNVFGPRQHGTALIPNLMVQARQRGPLQIHGDGSQFRYFCHVNNVVEANIRAAAVVEKGEFFVENIRDRESHTVLDIAKEILRITADEALAIEHTETRIGDVHGYRCEEPPILDYFVTPFSEGLRQTIERYLQ